MGERNVPLAEVCERLGCSRQTVLRLIDEGRLTAYRYAREAKAHIWVALSSVDTFLQESRVRPGELHVSARASSEVHELPYRDYLGGEPA
jgi:excisionase family DNA binding protein